MMQEALKILLVEDDDLDAETVAQAFEKNKFMHEVYRAVDGMDALEQLTSATHKKILVPDIILLDINMPKMDGIEFLEHLRSHQKLKHLPVFVLTTSDAPEDILSAYQANVAGYIRKPVRFSEFMEAMKVLNGYWSLQLFPEKTTEKFY